jgi:hypothetical protein
MRVKQTILTDKRGIAIAKIANKIRQKKMQGVYDNTGQSPKDILNKRGTINFKKDFTRYVDDNYGDILSKKDIKKLHDLVEVHYESGDIDDMTDLVEHIESLGKEHNILFE